MSPFAKRFFYIKKPSQLATQRGSLGLFQLILLGLGAVMGTGVFVLTGKAAALFAGPAVLVSFVLAAVCAGLGAMCYAEMAGLVPSGGSAYAYAYATLGELIAFWLGWTLGIGYLLGAATIAQGWSAYAQALAASLGYSPLPSALLQAPLSWNAATGGLMSTGCWANLPAAFIIVVLGWILSGGVQASARINAAMVAIKLAVIVLFLWVAVPHIKSCHWRPFLPPNQGTWGHMGPTGVLRAAMLLFFAFQGFDTVSVAANDAKDAQRDVPIATLLSLSICAVVYMVVAAVLTGVVPYTELDVASPMAFVLHLLGAKQMEVFVDVGALVGLTTVLMSQIFAQPRILLAMAQDRLLPYALAVQSGRQKKTPVRLTWLMVILAATLAALVPISVLAEFTSLGMLLVFATVAIGVWVQRVRSPLAHRRFRVPGGRATAALTVVVSVVLMGSASLLHVIELTLWMVAGTAYYIWAGQPRAASWRASSGK